MTRFAAWNKVVTYLVKPFAVQELEARIRALIRRNRRQVSTEVLKVGELVLDAAILRVTRNGRELTASPISLKLLTILMRESPRVVSRRDIEREIWGDALQDSDILPKMDGGELVLVDEHPRGRLFLVFAQSQVDALAFFFGAVPLVLVLIVIYVIAWLPMANWRRIPSVRSGTSRAQRWTWRR
jgi:hypothetical protein